MSLYLYYFYSIVQFAKSSVKFITLGKRRFCSRCTSTILREKRAVLLQRTDTEKSRVFSSNFNLTRQHYFSH